MYGIIGAMDEEISAYLDEIELSTSHNWRGHHFYEGHLFGKSVIVVKTGVGKVLSAMITQRMFDSFPIERIIFTGIGGSINNTYEIGDIVIGRDTVQHDLDTTALGLPRGLIPYTDLRIIPCDHEKVGELIQLATEIGTAHIGRILTGDVFVAHRDDSRYDYLREELAGDVVEMEGASVGTVAHFNGIPFNLIRVISDRADGSAPKNFKDFLQDASKTTKKLMEAFLGEVP